MAGTKLNKALDEMNRERNAQKERADKLLAGIFQIASEDLTPSQKMTLLGELSWLVNDCFLDDVLYYSDEYIMNKYELKLTEEEKLQNAIGLSAFELLRRRTE